MPRLRPWNLDGRSAVADRVCRHPDSIADGVTDGPAHAVPYRNSDTDPDGVPNRSAHAVADCSTDGDAYGAAYECTDAGLCTWQVRIFDERRSN